MAFTLIWIIYVPIGYVYCSGEKNNRLFSAIGDSIIFNGVIIVGCAVSLFLIFVSANPYSNKTINMIAKSLHLGYIYCTTICIEISFGIIC